jgi:EAL domain-containing protein (putative c-di-GMP-specific phosphodiesterase class I)
MRLWRQQDIELNVAINLSAQNLYDPKLDTRLRELILAHDVPPHRLTVEVTETAMMTDTGPALDVLAHLHELGVHIAIDDFGTGYSSLAYLKRLPVDELKIDQSFISDLARNDESAFIARSVIELGHHLGLTVVAEGVEDESAWSALRAMGCDLAQGYYVGRPQRADQLVAWLSLAHAS